MQMNIYKLVEKLFKCMTRNLFLRNCDSFTVTKQVQVYERTLYSAKHI